MICYTEYDAIYYRTSNIISKVVIKQIIDIMFVPYCEVLIAESSVPMSLRCLI